MFSHPGKIRMRAIPSGDMAQRLEIAFLQLGIQSRQSGTSAAHS